MTDLDDRNWKAVSDTLVRQNDRFVEMEVRIKALHNRVLMLAEELEKMKQERMVDLVARFGAGPTSRE